MIPEYLEKIRTSSIERLDELVRQLGVAEQIIQSDGTIYATGSFGRLEAGPESDLDVFIVSLPKNMNDSESRDPLVNQVRQIRLKSELIVGAQAAGMAEFDGGGRFLETHLYGDIVNEVGSPADDFKNTFTGRMLLILESRSILGSTIYDRLKSESINSYFGDFEGNENKFVPYFLINDLLRMWRTFCVNYEFFRKGTSDWRIKNLKLKYTRMLTCFSAIIYISAVYRQNNTVTPRDIEEMSALTPVDRLNLFGHGGKFEEIGSNEQIAEVAQSAIRDYSEFLELVQEKNSAIKALKKDEKEWRERSYEFGGKIATLVSAVNGTDGLKNRLFRSILV